MNGKNERDLYLNIISTVICKLVQIIPSKAFQVIKKGKGRAICMYNDDACITMEEYNDLSIK